jgi:hypothetical protein
MDGDIDYSRFSRAQLEEALTRIDKVRFPKNLAKLMSELEARGTYEEARSAAITKPHRDLAMWVRWLGWYQLLATVIVAHKYLTSDLSYLLAGGLGLWLSLALLTPAAITAVAAVLILRRHPLGPHWSILSFSTQAISLTLPGFSYQYAPLLILQAFWSEAKFGIRTSLGPDSTISFGGNDPIDVAIDILAVGALIVLLKFMRARNPIR